jgi:hypothetical protein
MSKRDNTTATCFTYGKGQCTASLKSTTELEGLYLSVFKRYHPIWERFKKSHELVDFYEYVQAELLVSYRALVDPFYHYDRSCSDCKKNFITLAYIWYDSRQ